MSLGQACDTAWPGLQDGEKRMKVIETIGGQSTGITGNGERWGWGQVVQGTSSCSFASGLKLVTLRDQGCRSSAI